MSSELIIFDHLAKTSGSSVAKWLMDIYGAEAAAWYQHETHINVLAQFKRHKVACGHTYFFGEGLSETCQYTTLIRDPRERVVSWLYFCLNNHDDGQIVETRRDCVRFIGSNDDILCDDVTGNITNNCVEHFSRIYGSEHDDEDTKLANAIRAVDAYAIVGLYEDAVPFRKQLLRLIGDRARARYIPFPFENVTRSRPRFADVPETLKQRILARNRLDIALYDHVRSTLARRSLFRRFYTSHTS